MHYRLADKCGRLLQEYEQARQLAIADELVQRERAKEQADRLRVKKVKALLFTHEPERAERTEYKPTRLLWDSVCLCWYLYANETFDQFKQRKREERFRKSHADRLAQRRTRLKRLKTKGDWQAWIAGLGSKPKPAVMSTRCRLKQFSPARMDAWQKTRLRQWARDESCHWTQPTHLDKPQGSIDQSAQTSIAFHHGTQDTVYADAHGRSPARPETYRGIPSSMPMRDLWPYVHICDKNRRLHRSRVLQTDLTTFTSREESIAYRLGREQARKEKQAAIRDAKETAKRQRLMREYLEWRGGL